MSRRPWPMALPLIAILSGCVSDGPSDRPRSPGPQPIDAAPSHLVINTKDFVDTDQNGYLDTAAATIYIFAEGYALPIDTAGSFVFTLTDPTGSMLAEWVVTADQAAANKIRTQVGPGYAFNLDLRQAGAEKTDKHDAAMTGRFVDRHGRSVQSGRLSVTVGRAR